MTSAATTPILTLDTQMTGLTGNQNSWASLTWSNEILFHFALTLDHHQQNHHNASLYCEFFFFLVAPFYKFSIFFLILRHFLRIIFQQFCSVKPGIICYFNLLKIFFKVEITSPFLTYHKMIWQYWLCLVCYNYCRETCPLGLGLCLKKYFLYKFNNSSCEAHSTKVSITGRGLKYCMG